MHVFTLLTADDELVKLITKVELSSEKELYNFVFLLLIYRNLRYGDINRIVPFRMNVNRMNAKLNKIEIVMPGLQ